MTNEILSDVKIDLGSVYSEISDFDDEIMNRINECFPILYQLGIGSLPIFIMKTGNETWDDYLKVDYISLVKKYIYTRVKLTFDPPSSTSFAQALREELSETEFRLYIIGAKDGDG